MSIATAFHNYQTAPLVPDRKQCSPFLTGSIRPYLIGRWGGVDLGCYAARPIREGGAPSTHASGAALDWRYQNPGCGRDRMTREVLPFLINNSGELGVQAIHDYFDDRVWRPPAYRGGGDGWKDQGGAGGQMGEPWALWLHIEIRPERWSDDRRVADLVGEVGVADPPSPGFDPAAGKWGAMPHLDRKRPLGPGDNGDAVAYAQGVIKLRLANFALLYGTIAANKAKDPAHTPRHQRFQTRLSKRLLDAAPLCRTLKVDGQFGVATERTVAAIKDAFERRVFEGLRLDFEGRGRIGAEVWRLLDGVADGRW